MPVTRGPTDVTRVVEAAADRFARLLADVPDPTVPVPDLPGWTVADAAAHVVSVAPRYARAPEGAGTWVVEPADLGALNDAELAPLRERPLAALGDELRDEVRAVLRQIEGYGGHVPSFRFHGGSEVGADVALGILLGELLVHGRDVARAARCPWSISAEEAAMVVEGVSPILPGWVDREGARGLTASFDLHLRGHGHHVWAFEQGRLRVDPPERRRPDVRISADPVAFVLVLYRRASQWPAIARGRLVAWGRRPWLAFTLADRFHRP